MKCVISIVFFISSIPILFGQQFVIDSLSHLLKIEKNPMRIADLHLGLCRANNFVNNQTENIKYSTKTALDLSRKYGYREGEAIALILEAKRKYNNGEKADVLYENIIKAIAIAQSIPSKSVEAFAQYNLAEYYLYDKNDYTTGINILTKTIKEADDTVADKHIGNCYKVLGLAYETNGQYSLALDNFEKALSYFNRVKTHPFIDPKLGRPSAMEADYGIMNWAHTHLYIGRIYETMGIQEKAIEYLTTAKRIYESTETPLMTAITLEELGFAYQTFGLGEKAIESYQSAAKIFEAIESDTDLSYVYQKLGQVFISQKDYGVAESYLSKSLIIAERRADTILLMDVYDALGKVYSAQEKYDQALTYMKERENISIALEILQPMHSTMPTLVNFYLNKKNIPNLYNMLAKH